MQYLITVAWHQIFFYDLCILGYSFRVSIEHYFLSLFCGWKDYMYGKENCQVIFGSKLLK
jgi:hypothetical protein